jgi:hypothetical protein
MRPTMLLPMLLIAAGALSCVFIRRRPRTAAADAAAELGEATATAAG